MPECPPHYAKFLRDHGGVNLYGEPNFILHWGSQPVPRKVAAPSAFVMPEAMLAPYLGCWVLAEWNPPSEFGPEALWDLAPEMPYPTHGAYVPLSVYLDAENHPAMVDSAFLNLNVLGRILYVTLHHKHDSLARRMGVMRNEMENRELARSKELIDRIEDYAPAFGDAATGYGSGEVATAVRRKMDLIERNIGRLRDVRSRFPRGMFVRSLGESNA